MAKIKSKKKAKQIKYDSSKLFRCNTCGKDKTAKSFSKDGRHKTGLKAFCKVCEKKQKKLDDIDKELGITKSYRDKHITEKIKESSNMDKHISERLSDALLVSFGENLESIVTELNNLIFSRATKDNVKLAGISVVLDRIVGKPKAEMVIEQKLINITINKPNLDDVIDIPKS